MKLLTAMLMAFAFIATTGFASAEEAVGGTAATAGDGTPAKVQKQRTAKHKKHKKASAAPAS